MTTLPSKGARMNEAQSDALHQQLTDAVKVWHAANEARGLPPSAERVRRVAAKLAAPDAVVVLVQDAVAASGMALAEPGRADDGMGAVISDRGHVSMVFVRPDVWGRGVGREVLWELHRLAAAQGWSTLSLWARISNERARRLYERLGYRSSGRQKFLLSGDSIVHYERESPTRAPAAV